MVADEDEPIRPNTVVTVSLSIMIGVCFLKQLVKHNNYLHAAWERNTPFGGPARATLRQEVRQPWWNENRLVLEWRRSITAHGYRPDHFWDVVSNQWGSNPLYWTRPSFRTVNKLCASSHLVIKVLKCQLDQLTFCKNNDVSNRKWPSMQVL